MSLITVVLEVEEIRRLSYVSNERCFVGETHYVGVFKYMGEFWVMDGIPSTTDPNTIKWFEWDRCETLLEAEQECISRQGYKSNKGDRFE